MRTLRSPVAESDQLTCSFQVAEILLVLLDDEGVKIVLVAFVLPYFLLHDAAATGRGRGVGAGPLLLIACCLLSVTAKCKVEPARGRYSDKVFIISPITLLIYSMPE